MTTIGLCMIVKNEAAVVARCLQSVLPLIHSWTVVDTGSTDNTQQVVQDVLGHLPGRVHQRPWVDFAHNRTEAFRLNKPYADYHLVIDADDWLEFPGGHRLTTLTADQYVLPIHYQGVVFQRPQLFRAALDWRYEGVVHEYSHCPQAHTTETLPGVRYQCSSGQSARSRNPHKFSDDAAVLEKALTADPTNTRYAFYLAQSYRDAGDFGRAAAAYARRTQMEGWSEEIYISHLERARMLVLLGSGLGEVRSELLEAVQINPLRAEALVELARLHREAGHWHMAFLFASQAAALKMPTEGLFLENASYEWRALDELALACFYTGRRHSAQVDEI